MNAIVCTCTPFNRSMLAAMLHIEKGMVHEQACVNRAAIEARAQALAEVRAAVEGLDGSPDYCISHVEGLCGFRAAVLAALDRLTSGEGPAQSGAAPSGVAALPATPRPGIDRLACPGCGTPKNECRDFGEGGDCCDRCRHRVRPCIGSDAG